MPRKNNIIPHTPYRRSQPQTNKRRFATKQQAEQAAEEQMLLKPELALHTYRDIDGGWYLTRKEKPLSQ